MDPENLGRTWTVKLLFLAKFEPSEWQILFQTISLNDNYGERLEKISSIYESKV